MWQVKFPRGWQDIDQDAQAIITSAYESGSPTVEFATLQSQRLGLWRRYVITFSRMEQMNLDSERIRKVRLFQGTTDPQLLSPNQNPGSSSELAAAPQLAIEDNAPASSSHLGTGSEPGEEARTQSAAKPREREELRKNKIPKMWE